MIRSDLSGFSGHKACVACACVAAASACLVLLLVLTPGVSVDCARHLPRPLPLSGHWTEVGVAGGASARAGDISGVTIFATVVRVGGTDAERGHGASKAGMACARSLGGSWYGLECMGASAILCMVGDSSIV